MYIAYCIYYIVYCKKYIILYTQIYVMQYVPVTARIL